MRKLNAVILLLAAFTVKAQTKVYLLDSNRQVHDLRPYTYILVDSLEQFTHQQITSGKLDHRFIPLTVASSAKKSNCSYWLRFFIQPNSAGKNWLVILKDSLQYTDHNSQNENVKGFYADERGNVLARQQTGVFIPRSKKSVHIKAGINAMLLSTLQEQIQKVYIQVPKQSGNYPAYSYPVIYDPALPLAPARNDITLRLLNAITLTFCILSFFFYFFIKERSYLFFGLYTLFLSQHYLILHNDLPFIDLYIREHPWLVSGFWRLLAMGSLGMFFIFGRYFTNLRTLSKKTDKWYVVLILVWAAVVIADTISLFISRHVPFWRPGFLLFDNNSIGILYTVCIFQKHPCKAFCSRSFMAYCIYHTGCINKL